MCKFSSSRNAILERFDFSPSFHPSQLQRSSVSFCFLYYFFLFFEFVLFIFLLKTYLKSWNLICKFSKGPKRALWRVQFLIHIVTACSSSIFFKFLLSLLLFLIKRGGEGGLKFDNLTYWFNIGSRWFSWNVRIFQTPCNSSRFWKSAVLFCFFFPFFNFSNLFFPYSYWFQIEQRSWNLVCWFRKDSRCTFKV